MGMKRGREMRWLAVEIKAGANIETLHKIERNGCICM